VLILLENEINFKSGIWLKSVTKKDPTKE